MQTFKVGQAPWEKASTTQTYPVGSAPWETNEEPEDDLGYVKRVASQYVSKGKDITQAIKTGSEALQTPNRNVKDVFRDTGTLLRTGLQTAGAIAGGAFAPIFEAPGIKQATELVAKKATEAPVLGDVIRDGVALAEKYPTAARDVRDIFDIVTLGTGKAIEAPLGRELQAIGGDLRSGTKALLTPSEEAVQKKVISLFQKSIKPTAKKTSNQQEKYNSDVLNALRTIKANSDQLNIEDATGELIAGRTPQSINELAQGLEQTKTIVFKQYDELAKQAGTEGAVVDALPIASEVLKVADSKALQLTNPEIVKYAESWSERLTAMGQLDAETAQEVIKLMNANLQAFYRNPTYDSASKVAIDASIANNFRVALDDAIGKATGAEYQTLKNQYGALKAIENDVVRASLRDARKNTKGLLDYSDIFTGGQILTGILSLNPAMFTKGAIERGFKEYIKTLNDPNRAVDNMFKTLKTDTSHIFQPTSELFKSLQNPSLGMSIRDVSKNGQEFQRRQSTYSNTPNKTKPNTKSISTNVSPKGDSSRWGTGTSASKPSTATDTSTSRELIGKEGVFARKADTSGGFDGKLYHGTSKEIVGDIKFPLYLSDNKAYAENYTSPTYSSMPKTDSGWHKLKDKPQVLEYDINPKAKVFDVRKPEHAALLKDFQSSYSENGKVLLSKRNLPEGIEGTDVQEFLESKGLKFDGMWLDENADRGLSFVAFNKNALIESSPLLTEAKKYNEQTYYHGGGKIESFEDKGRGGVYLTPVEAEAMRYAGQKGEVTKARINIKKPYIQQTKAEELLIMKPELFPKKIAKLKEEGYDALVSADGKQIFVFDASKVKRAD